MQEIGKKNNKAVRQAKKIDRQREGQGDIFISK